MGRPHAPGGGIPSVVRRLEISFNSAGNTLVMNCDRLELPGMVHFSAVSGVF